MDQNILKEVEHQVAAAANTYGISVTPQAVLILGECFTAISEDPHESWPKGIAAYPAALANFTGSMLAGLPAQLAGLANRNNLSTVTSFDLLHSMSKLVDNLCPFVKAPQAHP